MTSTNRTKIRKKACLTKTATIITNPAHSTLNNTHKGNIPNTLLDKLKAWPQYLLPHYALTDLMYLATRSKLAVWKNNFIRWFAHQYKVDMSLAINEDLRAYDNFNQFFTRPLKPEARPICAEPDSIACPVDGTISQLGTIDSESIFQAKGHQFSLTTLLAGQSQWVEKFQNGNFATMYLSPKDYHRIHMPIDGTLRQMSYVPGRLFSVSPATTRSIPGLFARNERVLCFFDTEYGPMAMILVGALFVGSIETVWHGMVTPPHGKRLNHWYFGQDTEDQSTEGKSSAKSLTLNKGQEMGRFNMGSTVILLFPANSIHWDNTLSASTAVQMGIKIAARAS